MRNNTCAILVCLFLSVLAGRVEGQGHGIEVRLTSQRLIEVEPGKIVVASYVVSNGTGSDVELYEKLELPEAPERWRTVYCEEQLIMLGVNEQEVRLTTFIVPKNCPPGKYEVTYLLYGRRHIELIAEETFSVVVLPVVKFDTLIEEKPDVVLAGDEYNVRMRLINRGNSTTEMKLVASASPDYPVAIDRPSVLLEPGTSQSVNFLVTTDAKVKTRTNHVLSISTEVTAPDFDVVSVNNSIFIDLMPRFPAVVDTRHRVPTKMRLIAVGDNDNRGCQVEYSGSGSLDENNERKIDFLFRGPDIQDKSVYGTRDAFRLNYSDRTFNLQVGDNVYSLSPLTERLIYGRGARVGVSTEHFDVGSIYLHTRWGLPEKKEFGGYASYRYGDKFRIKSNYFNKKRDAGVSVEGIKASIYTVQAEIVPDPKFKLGLEYGRSFNSGSEKSRDNAHRVTLDGNLSDKFWYTFENTYAGPKFSGYYSDVLYSNGTVAFPIYDKLRSNLSFRIYNNNLDLDADKPVATREYSYRGVLSYAAGSSTNLSLDYEALQRKDELSPPKYDYMEYIWRMGAGRRFSNLAFQTYYERAYFENRLGADYKETLHKYSLYAHFNPSNRQSYSVFTRIGHNSFTGNPIWTKNVGLSASLRLKNYLNLNVSYQRNSYDSENLKSQDYLFSTLDFILPNSHSISLRARWFNIDDDYKEELSFFAAYEIPFNLPAGRKKSIGVLKGRVFDIDKPGIECPMSGVIVSTNGLSTITDQSGEFIFPGLKPGEYALKFRQNTIGIDRVTTAPQPILIEVQGGRTSEQNIGVSTAAKIHGTVELYSLIAQENYNFQSAGQNNHIFVAGSRETRVIQPAKGDLTASGVLGHVLVEISDGKEILRQYTDEKGRFAFEMLRPGIWQMKIYEKNLPDHHVLDKSEFQIELTNGAEENVTVKVVPKLRSVRIIDSASMK